MEFFMSDSESKLDIRDKEFDGGANEKEEPSGVLKYLQNKFNESNEDQ